MIYVAVQQVIFLIDPMAAHPHEPDINFFEQVMCQRLVCSNVSLFWRLCACDGWGQIFSEHSGCVGHRPPALSLSLSYF